MKLATSLIVFAAFVAASVIFSQTWVIKESNAEPNHSSPDDTKQPDDDAIAAATKRARKTVKMLDDIYKGGIVTITDKYVTKDSEIPAGTAFKEIFAIAKKKGWHEARLLDVTGEPYSDENVAVDDFEKRAVKKIVAGSVFYEEIEEVGDEKYFRAMTPIPVVFEKCTWCHSNYENLPAGQAIGAMGYRIKIETE